MRGAALLTAVLLVGCYDEHPTQQERTTVTASTSTPATDSASPEYKIGDHVLRLVVTDKACIVEHRSSGAGIGKLTLDLLPPCHLLTWRKSPAAPSHAISVSDGLPVGTVGDPMAWQYASAKGVIALAVIGDPLPESLRNSSLYSLRQQQGLSCTSSVQAVLLRVNQIQLSRKREHAGVFCTELGLDEKDFWMLAHP